MPEKRKKLVVYTAVVGGFNDLLREPAAAVSAGHDVRFVCFSDSLGPAKGGRYEVLPPQWEHADSARRTARWHKLHPHVLFPDADFTVWHDGSHQVAADPWRLADVLGDRSLGSFSHPQRQCVYDELRACVQLRKDNRKTMEAQVERYRREGYPANAGLFETACVVRDNSEEVRKLNEAWWDELRHGSYRDQLSLNYVVWRNEFRGACLIPGCRERSPFFNVFLHR